VICGTDVAIARGMTRILQARPRRTVLVVEDALTTRCILEQFFARAGCDVLHASDPETALLRLRSATIDAVILDLRLADNRSGLEVLEQMRLDERYDAVPVVVLTGVTEVDETEDELIQRHGAHLLYKRFGYREVVQRLEKILTAQAA
jgi:two-component system sensor histidine kinase and response regulator WspE